MIEMIEREKCVISNEKDLEHLYTFKDFPVFMGCTDQPSREDLRADMIWYIGKSSGMIQLQKLLPLNILYQAGHNAGAVGWLWTEHHRAFAKFIARFSPSLVFEIGGGHGILGKEYKNLIEDAAWTILEPNPPEGKIPQGISYIKGFFDEKFNVGEAFDAIVHSHVFEHMYDVDGFVKNLSASVGRGKRLFFSIPNMRVMLERKYTNCINFEHTIFLSEEYVDYLLSRHGFKILSKEFFKDDHSIFYACSSTVKQSNSQTELYVRNKKLFTEYIGFYEQLITEINQQISSNDSPVYLFGAHIFSQYLIAFGLETKRIASILDNAPSKQGKRLYGTNLMVESPSILKEIESPTIILRAGVYNQEIMSDILNNINPSAQFFL